MYCVRVMCACAWRVVCGVLCVACHVYVTFFGQYKLGSVINTNQRSLKRPFVKLVFLALMW